MFRCSQLEAENSSLQERLRLAANSSSPSYTHTTKDNVQHTNELLYLKVIHILLFSSVRDVSIFYIPN
jgi:hypothetical protein